MLIPKLFHQVWLGGGMPVEYVRYSHTWLEHHPGWKLMLWSEDNLPDLSSQPNFLKCQSHSEKSDFIRHTVLSAMGGVYIDTDFLCLRNMERLLAGVEAFAASENNIHISCGIMGCVPGHKFFHQIAECLRIEWVDHRNAAKSSGPQFVTKMADKHNLRHSIVVFPPDQFYPVKYEERYTGNPADYPGAYAVHVWGASWLKN